MVVLLDRTASACSSSVASWGQEIETLPAGGWPVASGKALRDNFGRQVSYLRLSVTDRCDLRCTYCMPVNVNFVPRKELLDLEELYALSVQFMSLGVRKIRVTGGEPLVRRNIMSLFKALGRHVETGDLDELTLTTNGTQLARYAGGLAAAGVKRVNVSLDTLDGARYAQITRGGKIAQVFDGLTAAQDAGLKVKINAVAMRGAFETEVDQLIAFTHQRGMDLTLIEEMPLGIDGFERSETYLPLNKLRAKLEDRWTLTEMRESSGGPARYFRVDETGGKLGFITPLSCDFCASCNRVRVSATGKLYTCMGQEGSVDLHPALRGGGEGAALETLIRDTVRAKPQGHQFAITGDTVTGISRSMSVLGG